MNVKNFNDKLNESVDGKDKKRKAINENSNPVLKNLINQKKNSAFVKDYEATDEEGLGMLIARYFEWGGEPILKTLYYALEDANFHQEASMVLNMIKKYEKDFKGG